MHRTPLALSLVLVCTTLTAQTAETVLLPDLLDLRPAAARATARITELTNEAALQATLGNPQTAATVNAIAANLQAVRSGATPVPAGTNIELHVVGFYEGNGAGGPVPATASVEVDRPGTAVVLVLNAYEPITWTVTETAGTSVIAVVSWSYEPQVLVTTGVPNAAVVQLSYVGNGTGDYFGIPEELSDAEARFRAGKWCLENLGGFATTFTGAYTAPPTTQTVGPADPVWLDQWIANQAANEGAAWNVATRATLQASLANVVFLPLLVPPLFSFAPSTVAIASPLGVLAPIVPLANVTSYAIGSTAVYTLAGGDPSILDLSTLSSQPIPPDPQLPPFSWVNSIAYDSLRDRLLVSSSGGLGTLYAWDVATATWSVLTGFNFQKPAAIAYHPTYDATFGVRVDPYASVPYELRQYDALGNVVSALPLPLPTFHDFLDNHQLYAVGAALAYVGPPREVLGFQIRHCYVINPFTADVLYSGFWLG